MYWVESGKIHSCCSMLDETCAEVFIGTIHFLNVFLFLRWNKEFMQSPIENTQEILNILQII